MTHNHSTKNSEGRPIASIALRTAGLIGAVILTGLFVASCESGATDVDTTVAAATRAQPKTIAVSHFAFERLDHAVVNQHSEAHDSDQPGASIAQYGK